MRGSRTLLAALLLLGCLGCDARAAEDPELAPLAIGGDFNLTGTDGKPFALSSLRGKTVLLFFGYTTCPDVCPTTLARLARVYEDLESEGAAEQVTTLFVSVDPERDTLDKLREYLGYFAVPALGVTGTPEQVTKIARQYGASYEKVPVNSAARYLINHSTYVYLIDPLGRVRHLFRHEDPPEEISRLVLQLAAEDCCAAGLSEPDPRRPRQALGSSERC